MNRLEPIARYWRGSLLQQGWRLWLTELRVCVPAWLALREPPEQRWHWPLSEPVASAPGNARHVLVLAADAVLLQTIHLPVAAARNLSAVVGYELDRYTPFEADRLYFVARQERRTPTQLQVTLVRSCASALDQILSDCAALGLQPHRVDVGDLGIDLLPAPLRPRPRPPGKGLQRSLPWLCGALLIAAMLLWLNDRQSVLDTMYDSVQQQKAQVAEVHALRQQLLATRGAVQYLTRRKVAQPPLVALLDDLTRCLPADTWLDQLDIKGSEIAFSGQSAKASALITRIKGCHRLDNAQFEGVIQPDARSGKDQFALRAHLRPEAADAPTPHTP
ncbi:general secretion pathway protein GspL [Pseudomonas veronii]|nr:general secretion pathway protein GspL [Pseudomonas veronii]